MPDPIASNELVKNLLDIYRVFSQEMELIRMKKTDLIKSIITRVDAERAEETRATIKNNTYDQS